MSPVANGFGHSRIPRSLSSPRTAESPRAGQPGGTRETGPLVSQAASPQSGRERRRGARLPRAEGRACVSSDEGAWEPLRRTEGRAGVFWTEERRSEERATERRGKNNGSEAPGGEPGSGARATERATGEGQGPGAPGGGRDIVKLRRWGQLPWNAARSEPGVVRARGCAPWTRSPRSGRKKGRRRLGFAPGLRQVAG